MFALFLSPLFRWIAGLSLAGLLLAGGWWYLGHLKARAEKAEAQVVSMQKDIETLKKFQAKKTETKIYVEKAKEGAMAAVDSGNTPAIKSQYDLLRQRAEQRNKTKFGP